MSKVPYPKPALTLQQQLEQLKLRGMQFSDEQAAQHYLGYINYYRLTAYWLPFEADHRTHQFVAGTTFGQVLDRYVFDRELRLLLIDAIERTEVAIRTQFAYQLGLRYGPRLLTDPAYFKVATKGNWNYLAQRQQLERDVRDSKEAFIKHLCAKYSDPLPPVWALVEIMTLGQLSKWYANLTHGSDRNLIANVFDFDEINLVSFLHHLAIIRNLCAHHSRVWNREFAFTFKLPRHRPSPVLSSLNYNAPKRLYNTLVLLVYLLDTISPGNTWKQRFCSLLETHTIPEREMGFPADWHELPVWK